MQSGLKGFSSLPNMALGMPKRFKLRGQALVEFAIILILVILVVAGGAELAITAYSSSKVSDAAKAGATEWGQMISHAKNPQAPNVTSQPDVGLGDHAVTNFASPSCGGPDGAGNLTYDDGMPDDRYLLDKKNRDNYFQLNSPTTNLKSIYLFNPLPIDHQSCFGTDPVTDPSTDPNRGDRSRISILINGYGFMYLAGTNTPNPLYVPGLPKVNQAMYSMYQQVCLTTGNELARCDIADERLLFPPGKLCLGTGVDEENCPDDGDTINVPNLGDTGYFFFGASNNAPKGSKQYIPSLAPEFRPTFQIECPGGTFEDSDNMSGCDSQAAVLDICWNATTSIACQLKVHVRYRSIFESFITFGMAELPTAEMDNLPYFYNPSKVGVSANSVKGIAGSEIGPLGANRNPTVKPFKDFRGCYESVNPGSLNYQVVSCN